jgi:hypothetical protein
LTLGKVACIFAMYTTLGKVIMAKAPDAVGTPPYLPWVTFINFLRQIKGSIPTRIDSTVLKGKSGSDQSGIKTALRFFRLIGADDTVTRKLHGLTTAMDSESWKNYLAEMIIEAYLEITKDVDLDNGTLGELQEAFSQRAGVTGSVRDKAIRFYLTGIREAGITVSSHFGGSVGNGDKPARSAARRTRRSRNATSARDDGKMDPPPDGREVNFPIPGKSDIRLWLPQDLTEGQWQMLDDYIRAYIKLRTESET